MEFAHNHVNGMIDSNDIARFPKANVKDANEQQSLQEIFGIPFDRLRELAEAESEGRAVVLPCKVGEVVAWDNGAGSVLKLFVKAVYHDGAGARLLLKNAAGKFFDAEPLANHPSLRYGAEAERALADTEPKGGLDGK